MSQFLESVTDGGIPPLASSCLCLRFKPPRGVFHKVPSPSICSDSALNQPLGSDRSERWGTRNLCRETPSPLPEGIQ